MIDLEKINERKQVIAKDIEAVQGRIAEAQKKIAEDQALLNALMGAFQQCDAFAKELDNDEIVYSINSSFVFTQFHLKFPDLL